MRYGTVCSGIEAPSVAWEPLGWKAQWFSEIEKFPKAVLAHHYPNVPDLGDMTKVDWNDAADIDVLIGGTPCQSFSVAGLRKGLDDPRGNLALEFLKIVDRKRPRWVVWENVPGVLSSSEGRDFGAFIGGMAELRYGFCWRVLDAQFFGVPQRRRRVFLVGHSGGWTSAAAVLFERESLSGNPAPSRETGEAVAQTLSARTRGGGGLGTDFDCDGGLVVSNGEGSYGITLTKSNIGKQCNNQTPLVAFYSNEGSHGSGKYDDCSPPIKVGSSLGIPSPPAVAMPNQVRRLTPVECERLQGFPDNYTSIPWRGKTAEDCPDGPRYKALGNSMAVPVIRWIGERIEMVEGIS